MLGWLVLLASVMSGSGNEASEPCRQAHAAYNDAVSAIHAAIRDYERCVGASMALDDCGAEFIELEATHRDFEDAVGQHRRACLMAPSEPR